MRTGALLTLLAALGLLATAPPATANAPRRLTVEGQLADATGAPLDGNVLATFTIYDSAVAGAQLLWSETQTIQVHGGRFDAALGEGVPLDPAAFLDAVDAHLGVAIAPDGEMGRTPLAAAAYAFFAERADVVTTVDGLAAAAFARSDRACPAGEAMTGVQADGAPACVPDADTTYSGVDFAVSGQSCPAGQLVVGVDASGAVTCAADVDTTYDGGDFAVSGQTCPAGQHLRGVDGAGALVCAPDADTTYDGTDFALSGQGCTAPLVARGFDASGALLCATDVDTTYSGANFATSGQACAAGQLATGVDAGGHLTCAPDADANTTYSGTSFALSNQSCGADQVATGVGASGALTCQSVSAWDRSSANDLTTATTFGGALTGTYGALAIPDGSITASQLSTDYVDLAGESMTGPISMTLPGNTFDLGHSGGIDFGSSCTNYRAYPTDWEHVSTTTDGFCITTGENPAVADDETLFITAQDNGGDGEAIYFGSGFRWSHAPPTTIAPCWYGMRVNGGGVTTLYGALTTGAGALYADLAEHLPVAGRYDVGDVIVVDTVDAVDFGRSRFRLADTPYDPAVVGVVSDTAALAMGPPAGRAPVALAGLVKVKVDAGYGPIRRGDVLVASATPGHAMAATEDVPGAGLGKALQGHERGRGVIMMMVAPR
ncbi:MAG: hypothetical protein EP329_23915 [Deltaproteobacteria bacterium]|nr:MAG: hypothetical protein EP329_23915 [Deltaproteobacteria bacterium]